MWFGKFLLSTVLPAPQGEGTGGSSYPLLCFYTPLLSFCLAWIPKRENMPHGEQQQDEKVTQRPFPGSSRNMGWTGTEGNIPYQALWVPDGHVEHGFKCTANSSACWFLWAENEGAFEMRKIPSILNFKLATRKKNSTLTQWNRLKKIYIYIKKKKNYLYQ